MPRKLKRHPDGTIVQFVHPRSKKIETATIIGEIWSPDPDTFGDTVEEVEGKWLETAFVAQLILWPNNERRIRMTYYTRRDAKIGWTFGQFSASLGIADMRKITDEMQKRGWLKESGQSTQLPG